MITISPVLQRDSKQPLYLQIYEYIKNSISNGHISSDEKLPSVRNLSSHLGVSLTTITLAYNQLMLEGYIYSRPQSGYYAADIGCTSSFSQFENTRSPLSFPLDPLVATNDKETSDTYDLSCFDFVKWKKCLNEVINNYPHLLLNSGDPQGEPALRREISEYIFQSRGVMSTPEQIVIGAGLEQITTMLCTILKKINITQVAFESPGYVPVQNIIKERALSIFPIPVGETGIKLEALPQDPHCCVYTSPSSQFPTGTIMPVTRRYQLLEWARQNNTFIIEDDYDSELRYLGKPVPALQGMGVDVGSFDHVIYLGSFSSTLFPAIKISYMVLPLSLKQPYTESLGRHSQTCSKTEQLALAIYMNRGHYQTNIKKLRKLYSQKRIAAISAIKKYLSPFVEPVNIPSGIHLLLKIDSSLPQKSIFSLCETAIHLGLTVKRDSHNPVPNYNYTVVFFYTQIPLPLMSKKIQNLGIAWKEHFYKD